MLSVHLQWQKTYTKTWGSIHRVYGLNSASFSKPHLFKAALQPALQLIKQANSHVWTTTRKGLSWVLDSGSPQNECFPISSPVSSVVISKDIASICISKTCSPREIVQPSGQTVTPLCS